MKPIIRSILDTDQYKATMQQGVLELFPQTMAEYRFTNRGIQKLNIVDSLRNQIELMSQLKVTDDEYGYMRGLRFFKRWYVEYFKNYRFDPRQVKVWMEDDNLQIHIKGPWYETILWEVPLLALTSEIYFSEIETGWSTTNQYTRAYDKGDRLNKAGCLYSEFGTRRRRSFETQQIVIDGLKSANNNNEKTTFVGTSNLYLAMINNLKCMGTVAHEWFMAMSVLEGLRHANYYGMQNWVKVYNADLGIALTDTYGTDSFFNSFNYRLSRLFDGVRHDSGDPILFATKAIRHYQKMRIDPLSKTIIFSDNLNVDKAIEIKQFCEGKIKCSFGIGTHFTNDFDFSKALNMVIKLWAIDGIPVVKLSDSAGKVMGDPDAVKVAKWTFFNTPLSEG